VDEKDGDSSTYTVEIRAKTRLRPQGKSAMKTMAYLRVSKDSQDVKNQRLAILEFARQERREMGEFMEVQISSRRSPKERQRDVLLARLEPGDTLIVSA